MDIIYFGNRNYWEIKKAGHTRYEQIFKKLISRNKHNVIYSRIFNWKQLLKHLPFYLNNYKRIKFNFSNNTLLVFAYLNDNLSILSIYTNGTQNILSNHINTIEKQANIKADIRMIWFNNYLDWNKIKDVEGYKYYFDSFEIFHNPKTGKLEYSDNSMGIYKDIVNNVAFITSISNEGVKFFKKINLVSKVYLVRNGVDLDRFRPIDNYDKKSKKVVGIIGNIHKYHDYSSLLLAAKELKNISFIIVGKISKSKELMDKETSENLDKLIYLSNVKYYEWIPVDDLPDLINTFDVGLITYKTKKHDSNSLLNTGDSLKKYQYLACNVPVISSNCQNVDLELSKGIFTYFEEKELKSLIEEVINKEKNINYRNLVKNYDWEMILDKILNYASLN